MSETVVVGMSGGVDSSVAAYLLKQQGYDVIGVTMQVWQDTDACSMERKGGCCGVSAVEDARRVCRKIGIPYYVMNFREEFHKNVIDYFIREYKQGHTPNPCIECNRRVKWECLLRRSMEIGADKIATGHYARVVKLPNGRYSIALSKTARKDQTYALYSLSQEQLAHTIMPIGDYEKSEVRKIAEEAGLPVANKPDSQEICFVADDDHAGYIERETGEKLIPGNFVDRDGVILGRHKGIEYYTIGQRKGLGIALGHPVYVSEIRPETNEVVLGEEDEIFTDTLTADRINLMGVDVFRPGERYKTKIRYSDPGTMCTVMSFDPEDGGRLVLKFDKAVRAVTPGQAAVLYKENITAGGGTIIK
ncbi:MAG: tRNA 2-thiouridine(34) synthase MnmA [Lachnospiraceae bacterium]|jgi:tRNA-specific 2-thiouridylase|nr:tRNA 2-thiouridine(34) synthase MnmA [Lachnospiraceae bacterium]MEE3460658.1 tRNA 2-thiouridine(34) synthase MnmA [Lachnospiraceae bacterium]